MLIDGELVTCQTEDLIRLHGFFLPAKIDSRCQLDAVLITHAIAGNYYNSRFLNRLALQCHDLGLPVLMANNRGHDVVNYVAAAGVRRTIGAANEIVGECTLDIAAWARLLAGRGFQRILVVGHSLGAIKALYSQAFRPVDNVAGLVCFSASRLCYRDFVESPNRDHFLELLGRAQALCENGDDQQLMNVDFPFPVLISAATYVDKYAEADRYNWLNFVNQVRVPTLLAFGEKELIDNAAFDGIIEQFEDLDLERQLFDVRVIEKANHYYTGCQQTAADEMERWISERFSNA